MCISILGLACNSFAYPVGFVMVFTLASKALGSNAQVK